MKKTYNVSLSGRIFHLEEDAGNKLQTYIQTLEKHYSHEEGGSEIMNDIEGRIAELLSEYMQASNKEVITISDVEEVIRVMGTPDDIINEDHNEGGQEKQSKKLYRDTDSRVIGGVASGIAAYLNVSVITVRVIFFILAFFYGSTIWIYIVLWICIPAAVTSKQRLEMKGERINISNIEKNIRDNINDLQDSGKVEGFFRKAGNFIAEILKAVGNTFVTCGSILLKIFAGIILIASIFMILTFTGAIFTLGVTPLTLVMAGSYAVLVKIAVTLILLCPVTLLAWITLKYLFRFKTKNSFVPVTIIALWIGGIALGLCIGFVQAKNFSQRSQESTATAINITPDKSLVVKINPRYTYETSFSAFGIDYNYNSNNDKAEVLLTPELVFEVSQDQQSEVIVTKRANGFSTMNAKKNALETDFQWEFKNDTLWIDNYSKTADHWRANEVKVVIRLPEKQQVYLDPSIHDGSYVNYWNVDRKADNCYTMQQDGLK